MIDPSAAQTGDIPVRQRILQTAHDLFYRDGIRATGVDKIIKESGVAKASFYRHYPTKNHLLLAFLEYRHQRWICWFVDAMRRHGAPDRNALLALVPVLAEWFANPVFRGCAFINIIAELGDTIPDAAAICRNHKQDMVAVITDLLPESPSRNNQADAVAVAIDGAIIKAQMDINIDGGNQALRALETLILALTVEFDR